MALKRYGVLKGRPIQSKLGTGPSPHYQIHIVDATTDYRIAVNVKSKQSPSELLYLVDDHFVHPVTGELRELPAGFTEIKSRPGGIALDYIRGNLFDRRRMRELPYNVPGPDNDLNEKIGAVVERAIGDEEVLVYAFGERWGPEPRDKDKYFGFLPGNGIHDIHMNQGNSPAFADQDGVWQDGGLLIHFPARPGSPEQWVGVFLAFQSQAWHTDDVTGHATTGPEPTPEPDGTIRIVAALVNPRGGAPERETVTLLNTTPGPIDLRGWSIANREKRKHPLSGTMQPGATVVVRMSAEVPLSNAGGIITVLDRQGLKVDGVSYTAEQADREGWTIVF
jgi:uncharacterized protein YukJ